MTEKPTVPQNDEFEDFLGAAQRVVSDKDATEKKVDPGIKISERGQKLVRGALRGSALVGIAGITYAVASTMGGGENTPDRGTPDPTIQTIKLEEGAHLRFDPLVPSNSETNMVETVQKEETVTVENDIRVDTSDTHNGTWYGINKEDLATSLPSFSDRNDKDGIIWVNEQGITLPKQETAPAQPQESEVSSSKNE